MILFLYKHSQNSQLTILQLDLSSVLTELKVSFVIFQYGGAQYEWSSSLNQNSPASLLQYVKALMTRNPEHKK